MKKEFLDQYYHETGNLVLVIIGIAHELSTLINKPLKNIKRIRLLIQRLIHRAEEFEGFRDRFGDEVKKNGV